MLTEKDKRDFMIRSQLEIRGIQDQAVLDAFAKVERHLFVLREYLDLAYTDEPLPIDCGQTISQPYVVAEMTELLELTRDKTVLEIGTGSGYQTAILAELAAEVYTIEIVRALHEKAKSVLASLGYRNIHAICGDGYAGYPAAAPFDAIIVTAAPPAIPAALIEQLKPNGRMVIPVGTTEQMLQVVTKDPDGAIRVEDVFRVLFVPMKKSAT